ncbi:MAG: ATP-binding protein [Planctomycetes bacterium]|nr:ATP-binding protein [Planctomycetota bacterium]
MFELANGPFLAATGRRDLVGRRLLDAFPELAGQGLDDLLRDVLRSGSPHVGDELLLRLDRTGAGTLEDTFWTVSLSPLRGADGRVERVAAIGFERTLQVQQRRELEHARGRAEAASRAKDEFFAVLGHELRNPIAPIVTALQLMKLQPGAPFARERAVIERHVGHVKRLVDDLLDASRLARGKVALARRRVDVGAVLARAVELASPLLEERQHRLVMEAPPAALLVDGDEDRLVQVAASLLANAAQFTAPRGTIRVAAARDGEEVTLSVSDDGAGIDPALLPRVFDLFVQGHRSPDRLAGGLGLGLSIVRSLVQLHGGSVTASSAGPGQGSAFTVRLPAARGEAAASLTPGLVAGAPRARRVLVVDDNQDAADLLAEALEVLGHETRRAFDAPSALLAAAEFAPDAALLDLGLPIMDGWELARRLRELPACRDTRLFAISGYGLEADLERSRAAGFEGHFVKPVDLDVVRGAVEAAPVTGGS